MNAGRSVLILGCYHELQGAVAPVHFSPDGESYAELVKAQLESRGITCIGEETDLPDTLAHRLATNNQIKWGNIDVTPEVKKRIHHVVKGAQIMNKDYTEYIVDPTYPEYRQAWALAREYHMFREFESLSQGHEVSLLICGLFHVAGFKKLLEDFEVRDVTPKYQYCRLK